VVKLKEALPVTVGLSLVALLVTYLIAIPVGIYSAVRPGTWIDRGTTLSLFMLYSMPSQWVAVMLIVLFGTQLHWLPIQGLHSEGDKSWLDLAKHVLLPLICLTYATFASLSRYMRSGMLEVIRQDYIRTARAKGLSERVVVLKHALRNSLISVITLLGLTLPSLVGGAVIIERIFGLPGMGQLSFEAIQTKDIPVLMGTTSLAGLLTMVGLLLSDVLYALVDPRIEVGKT
jgi:peptide/nickel transport system permease protein